LVVGPLLRREGNKRIASIRAHALPFASVATGPDDVIRPGVDKQICTCNPADESCVAPSRPQPRSGDRHHSSGGHGGAHANEQEHEGMAAIAQKFASLDDVVGQLMSVAQDQNGCR
jgi:hypothetical protein